MPARQPEREAARLLARVGGPTLPVDVGRIAQRLGAQVSYQRMDPAVSGLLFRQGDAAIIGVNAAQPERRKRFTLAHEIGHLAMHPGRPLLLDTSIRVNWRDGRSEQATDREEVEANVFAASLLMPGALVRQQMVEISQEAGAARVPDQVVRDLAGVFWVSPEAMNYRLIGLGLQRTG